MNSAFVSSEALWRSRRALSIEAVFIVIYINIIIPGKSGRYACRRPLVHLMYWCTHVLLDCYTWLCLSGRNLFGFVLVGVLFEKTSTYKYTQNWFPPPPLPPIKIKGGKMADLTFHFLGVGFLFHSILFKIVACHSPWMRYSQGNSEEENSLRLETQQTARLLLEKNHIPC